MTRFILWILDRFQGLFRLWQIDYNQLRLIVEVKLTMDNRRTYTAFNKNAKPDSEKNNRFLVMLLWYAFMSLFTGVFFVFLVPSPLWSGTLFFGYTMFVVGMALIADFSNILLDTADNQIILPLPVTSRTLLFARIIHIVSYLLLINFAVSFFPSLMFGFKYGWVSGVLMLLFSFQNCFLVVALANLFYLLVLRFGSEEKLRNIINALQIITTIFFTLAYQLIPRMIDTSRLDDMDTTLYWWYFLIPPFWFSGSIESLINSYYTPDYMLLIVLMVVVPVLTFWLINKYLAPVFSQKMASLGTAENTPVHLPQTRSYGRKTLSERLSGIFTNSVIEKTGFELTWKLTSRDQKFKLRTYPVFGSVIPALLLIFLRNGGSFSDNLYNLQHGDYYFFMIYISSLVPITFFQNMAFSEEFKAAWFYRSVPLATPGKLLSGALKAILVKVFLPFYLFIIVLLVTIWGSKVLPDLFLGFMVQVLFIQIMILASNRYLPFSVELTQQQQTGSGLKIMAIIVAEVIVGVVHFLVSKIDFLVLGAAVLLIPLIILAYKRYQQTDWNQMHA